MDLVTDPPMDKEPLPMAPRLQLHRQLQVLVLLQLDLLLPPLLLHPAAPQLIDNTLLLKTNTVDYHQDGKEGLIILEELTMSIITQELPPGKDLHWIKVKQKEVTKGNMILKQKEDSIVAEHCLVKLQPVHCLNRQTIQLLVVT